MSAIYYDGKCVSIKIKSSAPDSIRLALHDVFLDQPSIVYLAPKDARAIAKALTEAADDLDAARQP